MPASLRPAVLLLTLAVAVAACGRSLKSLAPAGKSRPAGAPFDGGAGLQLAASYLHSPREARAPIAPAERLALAYARVALAIGEAGPPANAATRSADRTPAGERRVTGDGGRGTADAGPAGCVRCHALGDGSYRTFTDFREHVIAVERAASGARR